MRYGLKKEWQLRAGCGTVKLPHKEATGGNKVKNQSAICSKDCVGKEKGAGPAHTFNNVFDHIVVYYMVLSILL